MTDSPASEQPIAKVISSRNGEVTVETTDGKKQKRIGDVSWRQNNPGNIRPAPFIEGQPGYVGEASNDVSGTFSVFRTREDGIKARYEMLFNNPKSQYYTPTTTIRNAMYSYAGPHENDTEGYIKSITDAMGVPDTTNISQLSARQKQAWADAITQKEGKKTGKIIEAKKGGITDGPMSGYPATLHGNEIIAPLSPNSILEKLAKTPVEESSTITNGLASASAIQTDNTLNSMMATLIEMMENKFDNMIDKLDQNNTYSDKLVKAMA
jgi:hypothetical protein